MDDEAKKLFQALRELGVKSVTFAKHEGGLVIGFCTVSSVEFFPSIAPLDLDTLVPPPGAPVDFAEPNAPEAGAPVPPAFKRILERGSVS